MSTINQRQPTSNAFYLLIALALAVTIVLMLCNSCTDEKETINMDAFDQYDHSIDYSEPIIEVAAAVTPCDSIYYEPVAYGGQLRILKNTISSGSRRGLPWWQCKSFAWQLIVPTKYQQDSTKERVVFADIDTIGYGDTFYICRKKHL
jgi:hypothetical protein